MSSTLPIVFLLAGTGVLFAFGIGMLVMVAVREKRKFYESAAKRLKGRYLRRALLKPHRIEFPLLEGHPAVVEFVAAGDDDKGLTRLIVPLEGRSPGTLHIAAEGFAQSFLKMFGAQDLSVGDRAFDTEYVVKATPDSLAAHVFSAERRKRAIQTVRTLGALPQAAIQLTRDQLRIQVREEIRSEGRLLFLVTAAKEFLAYLPLRELPTGIELQEMKTASGTSCPVCGTTLAEEVVRCDTCKSPQHLECWRYVGQCSTYACQATQYVA